MSRNPSEVFRDLEAADANGYVNQYGMGRKVCTLLGAVVGTCKDVVALIGGGGDVSCHDRSTSMRA